MTATTSRPHDEAIVEMLKADPEITAIFMVQCETTSGIVNPIEDEYLAVALDQADQPGGHQALLLALRHIAEAQGMSAVAERAGMPRESLYRALGPRGNPTIKTLLAILKAADLHLSVAIRLMYD